MLKALAGLWMCVKLAACTMVLGTILMGHFRTTGPSDATAPTISSVTASAGTYYFVGRSLSLTATFDEAVTVTGTPRIALTIGSNTRYATYASGSGTTTLVFTYAFVVGDSDTDGFAATSPIELNSGTIKDAAANNATLTFSAPDMSAKRAVLRGVTWGTDFELTSIPDLLGKIDGTTISAAVGVQGSTINSDTNDPTWVAGTGARFDGNDYFSSAPYAGGLSDYLDTGGNWSAHFRAKANSGNLCLFNSVPAASWATHTGCYFLYDASLPALYAVNDWNRHATYWVYYSLDNDWHTHSIVNDSVDLKWYVDGSLVATFTVWTNQRGANTSNTAEVKIGSAFGGTFFSAANSYCRAAAFCNVVHNANEISAAHAFLASLPT